MHIEYIKNYKNPFWRIMYNDDIYFREDINGVIYWTNEEYGQNKKLYDIQSKLEYEFKRAQRKEKINRINKYESDIVK